VLDPRFQRYRGKDKKRNFSSADSNEESIGAASFYFSIRRFFVRAAEKQHNAAIREWIGGQIWVSVSQSPFLLSHQ